MAPAIQDFMLLQQYSLIQESMLLHSFWLEPQKIINLCGSSHAGLISLKFMWLRPHKTLRGCSQTGYCVAGTTWDSVFWKYMQFLMHIFERCTRLFGAGMLLGEHSRRNPTCSCIPIHFANHSVVGSGTPCTPKLVPLPESE